ncbi:hypothetical protein M0804_005181 [Polistes exclamans]|nr:hypothetical protein M0804_005181 [Polistes exclamans]
MRSRIWLAWRRRSAIDSTTGLLSIGIERVCGSIDPTKLFSGDSSVYLVAVVGPGSELHVTVLVVKGEPSDVYLACALEDARWDV